MIVRWGPRHSQAMPCIELLRRRSVLTLAALALASGCATQGADGPLEESHQDFLDAQAQEGADYDYVSSRTYLDDQGGCTWKTTIEVRDDAVTRRSVEITPDAGPDSGAECPEGFVEEGEALGSFAGQEVAPVRTLDEWYALCVDEVQFSDNPFPGAPTVDAPFAIGEDGMLERCGWMIADEAIDPYGDPFLWIIEFEWI